MPPARNETNVPPKDHPRSLKYRPLREQHPRCLQLPQTSRPNVSTRLSISLALPDFEETA